MRNKKEPIDIWRNFLTDDMITTVLNNANKKVMALIEQLPEEVRSNDKYKYLREVTKEELAFIGISHARDLFGQNFLNLRRLFTLDVGHTIFSVSMRFNYLVFIKSMISFDKAYSRQERWRIDRFAVFRETFEKFNKRCTRNISPDDHSAINETLYPTIGGISFKTYNKDKRAKYGLNVRSLGSSRCPCTYYTVPYAGKPVEASESHIKDMLNLVKRIVEGYDQHGFIH